MLLNFTFEEASPLISYSLGQWTEGNPGNDTSAADYDGSFRVTNVSGATATLNFVGSSVSLFGALRGNHGNYTVKLDQDSPFTASGLSTNGAFQFPLFQSDSLSYTSHQVTVTNVPIGNNPYFDLDFVTIQRQIGQPSDEAFQVTLDDTASSMIYSPGSWSSIPSSTPLQHTRHQTTVAQAQVTIPFQGCCIELYGLYANAPYTVILDNQPNVTLQGPAVDLTSQQQHPSTLLYLMDGLSEDSHNVTLINNESNPNRPFFFDYAIVRSTKNFSNSTNAGNGNSGNNTGTNGGNNNDAKSKPASPVGPIVGGTVGGLLVLAILGIILFMVIRRRRRQHESKPEAPADYTPLPYVISNHVSRPDLHGQNVHPNPSGPSISQYAPDRKGYRFPPPTHSSSSEQPQAMASIENVLSPIAGSSTNGGASHSYTHSSSSANGPASHSHTLSASSTGLSHSDRPSTTTGPSTATRPSTVLSTAPPSPVPRSTSAVPASAGAVQEEDAGAILESAETPPAVLLPPAYNPAWHQEDRRTVGR